MNEIYSIIGLCDFCAKDRQIDQIASSGESSPEVEKTIKAQADISVSTIILPYISIISACVACYLLLAYLKIL